MHYTLVIHSNLNTPKTIFPCHSQAMQQPPKFRQKDRTRSKVHYKSHDPISSKVPKQTPSSSLTEPFLGTIRV
ncbi:hypothetical protein AB3S75_028383 [Citrus x aurantiifolia]